jgi:hypothetical protein
VEVQVNFGKHDFFANARHADTRPHRVTFRYDPPTRRLAVSGEDRDRDMRSIRDLVERGIIPSDLDAILHTAPSEVVTIIRGRHGSLTRERPEPQDVGQTATHGVATSYQFGNFSVKTTQAYLKVGDLRRSLLPLQTGFHAYGGSSRSVGQTLD